MVINKNPRSYEVSIWTLQDSFITILKPVNLECRGKMEEPRVTFSDENSNTFSFKIPMYIKENGKFIENPFWYNYTAGILMENMRKVKIIFNKNTSYTKVFEFLIIKVTEQHEGFEKYCEVECEELAFHELGKQGYKIELSADLYTNEYNDWADKNDGSEPPINNINYWIDKVLIGTNWQYSIEMDWGNLKNREKNKVYEEPYIPDYKIENNMLVPDEPQQAEEKLRLVEGKDSNRYNLLQTIAETFGVFCDFIYEHDESYNIIARKVVFYNNLFNERGEYNNTEEDQTNNVLDINYYYDTESISREKDSTELVTKMFVLSNDDGELIDNTITGVEANLLLEDYLLNFDYLYQIGTISQEQYEEISNYSTKIRQFNIDMKECNDKIIYYNNVLNHAKAMAENAKQSIILDNERIQEEEAYIKHLLLSNEKPGVLSVLATNPDIVYVSTRSDGSKYIVPKFKNILSDTLTIYSDSNCSIEFDKFNVIKEENSNFIKEIIINENVNNILYLTYDYSPDMYHKNLKEIWQSKLAEDSSIKEKYEKIINELTNEENGLLSKEEAKFQLLKEEKQNLINKFENIMGPSLREGTWTPEDEYAKYSSKRIFTAELTDNNDFNDEEVSIGWDSDLFEEEGKNYYQASINSQDKEYYPYINLIGKENIIADKIQNNIIVEETEENGVKKIITKTLGLVFEDKIIKEENNELITIPIKDQYKILTIEWHYATIESEVCPIALITGAVSYYNNLIDINEMSMSEVLNAVEGKIGYLVNETTTSGGFTSIVSRIEKCEELQDLLIEDFSVSDAIIYPRIKIDSLNFKNNTDSIKLFYNDNLLENFYDYYILNKYIDLDNVDNLEKIPTYAYYLTIRPESLMKNGGINNNLSFYYEISNTGLMIYLDAVKILKENSVPKVSYTVKPQIKKTSIIKTLYNRMHQLVHINDYDLKFENVLGYISQIELDLDNPQNDNIEIKNYKTKFEDLFSSIVASTESIKKNSYAITAASEAFTSIGQLNSNIIENVLKKGELTYSFNDGNLTITEEQGIVATSEEGVVTINNNGIFTANEKDENGQWIWNTGILPRGISANAITAGQLNTNLIRIYAGDNLRFQLNGDGLFAYKSWLDDYNKVNKADQNKITNKLSIYEGRDPAQYVVNNADGLFLIAEKDSLPVYDKIKTRTVTLSQGTFNWPEYDEEGNLFVEETVLSEPLEKEVKRVEISWSGLKLRNWKGKETFYADPDTGDLIIGGTLLQNASYITVPTDIMTEINSEITPPTRRLLKFNARLGSNEINKNNYALKDYIIEELVNDKERQDSAAEGEEVEQNVHFLTPNVAAVKVGDYINWSATSISNKILNDAIYEEGGRIYNAISNMESTLTENINNDYLPKINQLRAVTYRNTYTTYPSSVKPYDYYIPQTSETIGDYNFEVGKTYWYSEDGGWQEAESASINIGTGGSFTINASSEFNVIASKMMLASGSELTIGSASDNETSKLNLLTNGELHAFGSEIYLSNAELTSEDSENIDYVINNVKPSNGIILNKDGLSIYSQNEIILGASDFNENANTGDIVTGDYSGISLRKDGNITIITSSENKSNGIYLLRGEKDEYSLSRLSSGLALTGEGIFISSGSIIDISSNNFIVKSDAIDNENIFYVGGSDNYLSYNSTGLKLKGNIIADAGQIGPWQITEQNIYYGTNNFGSEKGIYFGKEGLSFGDIFKIKINKDTQAFESFIISNSYYIEEPASTIDSNEAIVDDGAKTAELYPLLSIRKLNEDENNYVLELGENVILPESNINSLLSYSIKGYIVRTTETEENSTMPAFPEAANGTLGIYYTDIQQSNDNQETTSIDITSSGTAVLVTNSYKTNYGIQSKYWNIVGSGGNKTDQFNYDNYIDTHKWARVGVAHSPGVISRASINFDTEMSSLSSGNYSIPFTFDYCSRVLGYSWDVLTTSNYGGDIPRSGIHTFELYYGNTKISTATFEHPLIGKSVKNEGYEEATGKIYFNFSLSDNLNSAKFSIHAFCETPASLIYINLNKCKLTTSGNTTSNEYGLYLKSGGVWNKIG